LSAHTNLYQWIDRMNCTSDRKRVSETGEILITRMPDEEELSRHLLVSITSLCQEVQHVATDELLNPDHDCTGDSGLQFKATGSSGCMSPAPAPASREKRTTPQHVGTTNFRGRVIGDSGFALEEIIFGGRFTHLEKRFLPPYLVCFVSVVCQWNIDL
jgi:hypothetical protein